MKIATYRLDSAVSITKKYARQARLDVVSKLIERMSQEVLLKQERNAWAVALHALANASTSSVTAASVGITDLATGSHVIPAYEQNKFQLSDLNKLMTLNKRINSSWADGTPDAAYSSGITDLYVSPEIKEQIRAFAYQPMNTVQAPSGTSSVPLPDNIRTDIFNAAGMQEIYGVNIVELNEFGTSQKYNDLFKEFAGTNVIGRLMLLVLRLLTRSWLVLTTARARLFVLSLRTLIQVIPSLLLRMTSSPRETRESVFTVPWKRVAFVSMPEPLSVWWSNIHLDKYCKSPLFGGGFFILLLGPFV